MSNKQLDLQMLPKMSCGEIKRVLDNADAFNVYINAVKDEAVQRIAEGQSIPGYKPTFGRKSEVWKEGAKEQLEALFGDEANETVISVAKAKKLFDYNDIKDFIKKPKPTSVKMVRDDSNCVTATAEEVLGFLNEK